MDKINISEVFDIAIAIEQNGENFYRKFAQETENKKLKDTFNTLAKMESDHMKLFEKMKETVLTTIPDTNTGYVDQEGLLKSYIRAFASGYVLDINAARELNSKDPIEVIKFAIGKEKDSIAYYLAVKEIVYSEENKNSVEKIINEEMKHIIELSELLASFID